MRVRLDMRPWLTEPLTIDWIVVYRRSGVSSAALATIQWSTTDPRRSIICPKSDASRSPRFLDGSRTVLIGMECSSAWSPYQHSDLSETATLGSRNIGGVLLLPRSFHRGPRRLAVEQRPSTLVRCETRIQRGSSQLPR